MALPPYQPGDLVEVRLAGEPRRLARISTLLPTDSSLPANQWMLTCRWLDDDCLVRASLHCGDDGVGRDVASAGERSPSGDLTRGRRGSPPLSR